MKIDIISLGKFKNTPPLKDVFEYYKKRIDLKVNLFELKTYNFEKKKLTFEKNEVKKYLKQNDCLIVLDKSGTMLSSEKFANFLNEKMINQTRRICFLIGSEIGLDDFLKSLKMFFHLEIKHGRI